MVKYNNMVKCNNKITSEKVQKNKRILLVSHIGLPAKNSDKLNKKFQKAIGRALAREFQGVTLISSQGYWITDRNWGLRNFNKIEKNTTVTILLSVTVENSSKSEKMIRKIVKKTVKKLKLQKISNVHIEKMKTKAYHTLII